MHILDGKNTVRFFFNSCPKSSPLGHPGYWMQNPPNRHEIQCTSECTGKAIQISRTHASRLHDKSKIKKTSKRKSLRRKTTKLLAYGFLWFITVVVQCLNVAFSVISDSWVSGPGHLPVPHSSPERTSINFWEFLDLLSFLLPLLYFIYPFSCPIIFFMNSVTTIATSLSAEKIYFCTPNQAGL